MSDKTKIYYIGDIARELGLSQRTIRYYEEMGMIKPSRTEGGFRMYSSQNVDILKTVIRFKELGVPLENIRAMIQPDKGVLNANAVRHLRDELAARREEFETKRDKYDESIRQIDNVLAIFGNCSKCGSPIEDDKCERCLKRRGGDDSPLIHPLLHHGED